MPVPGWYPDPENPESKHYRYWDGSAWQQQGPRQTSNTTVLLIVLAVIAAIAAVPALIIGVIVMDYKQTKASDTPEKQRLEQTLVALVDGTSVQTGRASSLPGYDYTPGGSGWLTPNGHLDVTVPAADLTRMVDNLDAAGWVPFGDPGCEVSLRTPPPAHEDASCQWAPADEDALVQRVEMTTGEIMAGDVVPSGQIRIRVWHREQPSTR